jgi:CBS domain-containing protein
MTTRTKRLVLNLETASDLMTPTPITVRAGAPVKDAIATMVERGISAVPVVDQQGKAVGVLSQTDIVAHEHKKPANAVPEYYVTTDAVTGSSRLLMTHTSDPTYSMPVQKLMTPTIFAVKPDDSVARVVGDMVAFKIHRLFVVDDAGVLVGVISAFDVLRKLRIDV